jgi:hypothetical protein
VLKFDFEHRKQPLAPFQVFVRRQASYTAIAFALIGFSWLVGALCYHFVAGIPGWVDSFYNAAMILGGMGPVDAITSSSGKIFASLYALYSGVILLGSVGIFLTPAYHRLMHRFHLETTDS